MTNRYRMTLAMARELDRHENDHKHERRWWLEEHIHQLALDAIGRTWLR